MYSFDSGATMETIDQNGNRSHENNAEIGALQPDPDFFMRFDSLQNWSCTRMLNIYDNFLLRWSVQRRFPQCVSLVFFVAFRVDENDFWLETFSEYILPPATSTFLLKHNNAVRRITRRHNFSWQIEVSTRLGDCV